MKVQAYSLDDIFEKCLLMLIPFYIFHMRKVFQSIIVMSELSGDVIKEIAQKYENVQKSVGYKICDHPQYSPVY